MRESEPKSSEIISPDLEQSESNLLKLLEEQFPFLPSMEGTLYLSPAKPNPSLLTISSAFTEAGQIITIEGTGPLEPGASYKERYIFNPEGNQAEQAQAWGAQNFSDFRAVREDLRLNLLERLHSVVSAAQFSPRVS